MFFIDDILLSPAKGFMWIVRELHNAAKQEIKGEGDRLTHRLSTLYMLLETGGISTEDFDKEEAQILARLDEIQEGNDAEDVDVDDDADEDDTDDEDDDVDEGDDDADEDENSDEDVNDPQDCDDTTDDAEADDEPLEDDEGK
jgi:hypothetical protein